MKLCSVTIHKYKSFEESQTFDLEKDITIMVGMNESGKTSALEAIAKTRYFQKDDDFKFNATHDYPRKDKKRMEKSGENPKAITCKYEIEKELLSSIEKEMGIGILKSNFISRTTSYNNSINISISVDSKKFLENKTKEFGIFSELIVSKLMKVVDIDSLISLQNEYKDEEKVEGLKKFEKYYVNLFKWDNPIDEFIYRIHLLPHIPKFLYYDEYYALPSRISIEKLENHSTIDSDYKTARALFELADINIEEIVKSENFEDFVAELESTEAIISDELFKYWKTNNNLSITFQVDKVEGNDLYNNKTIVEHILDIRIKSKGVSLPLKNRSKGFNWFFSFFVWFKKIQEDVNSNYILLLDEPGLNLHASAQADLLRFLEDLSRNYQIIYSTHSPFMISSDKLQRVRTVLETDRGSIISDCIQEKDPNTLFPLQAALGYNIAQNLYISAKNLLVEGVSDLIYLQTMSSIIECDGRVGLRSDITIVPTGGLEKVATFISLLRGNDLKSVCLLDSFTDSKGREKLDNLVSKKIINGKNIRFFHEFLEDRNRADIEDLFAENDFLKLFNEAFFEYKDIKCSDLNKDIESRLIQINKYLSISSFNHYRPANQLAKNGMSINDFESETIENFSKMFVEINKLFD